MGAIDQARRASWWAGAAAYLLVGAGGCVAFWLAVEDAEWLSIFSTFWWVASLAAAALVKHWVLSWRLRRFSSHRLQP